MNPETNHNYPVPPEDLEGESLLEWLRVCSELDSVGKLDRADRAILTIYVRTWQVWTQLAHQTAQHGPLKLWDSGALGQTTYWKEQKIVTSLLSKLITQLGLTPACRGEPIKAEQEEEGLEI